MTTERTLTVSRRRLVKIAFKAIDQYVDQVDRVTRNHLLYAACTMDQVAVGTWAIDDDCGCLVGTLLLNKAKATGDPRLGHGRANRIANESPIASPLWRLGMRFDELLKEWLTEKYGTPAGSKYADPDEPNKWGPFPLDVLG